MDAGDVDHRLTRQGLMFIVTSQTTVTSQPAEGSFHDPAPRENLKSFGIWRSANNFEFPAAMWFDPGNDTFVGTIRPNQFETTPAIVKTMLDLLEQLCQNQLASVPIL